ncbi:hypothetical protein EDB84DRAFT_1186355 [Lactarius hengduanensis]|nr:hypothetical protein EDB84DRAFT_1186355 [Lactarius hengduanensis]
MSRHFTTADHFGHAGPFVSSKGSARSPPSPPTLRAYLGSQALPRALDGLSLQKLYSRFTSPLLILVSLPLILARSRLFAFALAFVNANAPDLAHPCSLRLTECSALSISNMRNPLTSPTSFAPQVRAVLGSFQLGSCNVCSFNMNTPSFPVESMQYNLP